MIQFPERYMLPARLIPDYFDEFDHGKYNYRARRCCGRYLSELLRNILSSRVKASQKVSIERPVTEI